MLEVKVCYYVLGPSGSTQYHYKNRFFTGAMVNLSVPTILLNEEAMFNYDNLDSLNTLSLRTRSCDEH